MAFNALITGASVGIGRDLARLIGADGHSLILTARNQPQLESLASELRDKHGIRVDVLPHDLSQPDAPRRLFEQIGSLNINVDVLVNNAGFGTHGPFHDADIQSQLDMIQVNVAALTHLARLVLPGMVKRGSGRIMNIASTAAFQPGPFMAVYYATKAYVLAFSEALDSELADTGVTVTCVCPGPTKTEFHLRAQIADSPMFQNNTMESREVARIAYRAMLRGRRVVVPGVKNKILAQLASCAPRRLVTAMVKKLQNDRFN